MVLSLEAKLIAGALALALLLGGFAAFVHHERKLGAAKVTAAAREAGAAATAENKAKSDRREADIKEAANEAERLSTRAVDDAADAHAAGDRLLDRARSGAASGDPQVAAGSASASDAGMVPAFVLRAVVEAAERDAATADQRGIAGQACERSYGALTK